MPAITRPQKLRRRAPARLSWAVVRALFCFFILSSLLMLPVSIAGYPPTLRLSVEAVVLAGLMLLIGLLSLRLRGWAAYGLAACVLAVLALKLAMFAIRFTLDRPLNLVLDWGLLRSVYDLSIGTFGALIGTGLCALGVILAFGLWLFLAWCLDSASSLSARLWRPVSVGLGVALITIGVVLSAIVWPGWSRGNLSGIANRAIYEQLHTATRTFRQQREFRHELAEDDLSPANMSIPGLAGIDVLLIFVESYGQSAVVHPDISALIKPRLRDLQKDLSAAGLRAATTLLKSPTSGGQSWLAHASILSGLWVDNNAKYQLVAGAERATLIDLFENTGHSSVAIMPAIIWPWPEGDAFGYDRIYGASDLGYQASPFNWVTMPDQFTLSAFERFERTKAISDRAPVFAEIALISSHAPWTPIAELVDWDAIDEAGLVFDDMAQQGPTPAEVWSDSDRVRRHFTLSLDYVLQVIGSYAQRYVDDRTLMIVLGDHQPAPMVAGQGAQPFVPIHVIAKDPRLLEPFPTAGFASGLQPQAMQVPKPMGDFRNLIVHGFADPVE